MKSDIHPKYYPDCKVTCACGNTFTTGSTLKEISVDICSACHPFFTGKMKFIDTMGRVEKFQKRQAAAKKQGFIKKADRKKRQEAKEKSQPISLKEMILKEKKKAKNIKHE